MRFELAKRKPGRIEFGIIYGTITLFFMLAARFLPVLSLAPDCTFKRLTGLPCPTCGSTRAVVQLAHGHLLPACALNPLVFSLLIFSIAALLYEAITFLFDLPRISFTPSPIEKKVLPILCIFALFANWAYLVAAL